MADTLRKKMMVQRIQTGLSIPIINPNLLFMFKSIGLLDGHLTCPSLVKSDGVEVPPDIIEFGKAPTTGGHGVDLPQPRPVTQFVYPRPSSPVRAHSATSHLNTADTDGRRNCESAHCIGHNMRRLREDDDDRSEEGFRARKQRKQRPCFSCAGETSFGGVRAGHGRLANLGNLECRRLKMKCDRQGEEHCLSLYRAFCEIIQRLESCYSAVLQLPSSTPS